MFSQDDFIAASRRYVCVRLESYESQEHQDIVRSFLNGRFENTAFCLLAPDGKKRLTGSSRSPHRVMSTALARAFPEYENADVIDEMNRIAQLFKQKNTHEAPIVQDFHTFRQALNVASADQRLLVYVAAETPEQSNVRETLREVMYDPTIVGRFHVDFAGDESDAAWTDSVSGIKKNNTGIFLIQSDQFGMQGTVLEHLPLDADSTLIKSALSRSNGDFAQNEKRKVYSEHVNQGRRDGIYFKGGMPYGEDRNADGKIDHR